MNACVERFYNLCRNQLALMMNSSQVGDTSVRVTDIILNNPEDQTTQSTVFVVAFSMELKENIFKILRFRYG